MTFNQLVKVLGFESEKRRGWKKVNGYPVAVEAMDSREVLFTIFSKVELETDSGPLIVNMLDSLQESEYIIESGINEVSVELLIDLEFDPDEINQMLNDITLELKRNGIQTVCNICREPEIVNFCKYEGEIMPICDTCVNILNHVGGTPSKGNNDVLKGILFAAIGAGIGAAVMGILALIGFPYAAIAGALVLYLATMGYKISNSKVDKSTCWIILLGSLFVLVVAAFLVNDIYIMKETTLSKKQIIKSTVRIAFGDHESTFHFLLNLGVSIVLFFTFGFGTLKKLVRRKNCLSNLRRVKE